MELKPGFVDKWLEAFKPLAAHVKLHEPHTLACEVSIAENNPNLLFIYERCGFSRSFSCITLALLLC